MRPKSICCIIFTVISSLLLLLISTNAAISSEKTTNQAVYVPAYSHIYHGSKETPLLLSVTLSVRNVDRDHAIKVTAVHYHDTQGALIREYTEDTVVLEPLGSERFIVPQRDNSGGSGANFIVEWQAEYPVNPPIIEAVMIGTQSQLGISFTSRGVALIE